MVQVRLSPRSLEDRDRLFAFLAELSPTAAECAMAVLSEALQYIGEFPRIGRPGPPGYRHLVVRFGQAGYEIRYRVYPDRVFITRIFHTRESR